MTGVFEERIEVATPEEMHALGLKLATRLRAGDLVILTGPLGAGKTTLSRGIGAGMNVRGSITSPTFVIARTHPSLGDGPSLVHIDAYRIADSHEFEDLDIDPRGSVLLVEWGRGLVEPDDHWLDIEIERPTGRAERGTETELSDDPVEPRRVRILGHGSRWSEGLFQ